jgi:hypothetical protein
MPKNRWIYVGVVVIVATALLWIGAELTKRIVWILPYLGGAGVVLLVVGVGIELAKKSREKKP